MKLLRNVLFSYFLIVGSTFATTVGEALAMLNDAVDELAEVDPHYFSTLGTAQDVNDDVVALPSPQCNGQAAIKWQILNENAGMLTDATFMGIHRDGANDTYQDMLTAFGNGNYNQVETLNGTFESNVDDFWDRQNKTLAHASVIIYLLDLFNNYNCP